MHEKLVPLPNSKRARKDSATRVRDANPSAEIEVTINLRTRKPQGDQLPTRSLTPQQYSEQYGASEDDANKVRSVLQSYGITIEGVSLATGSMRARGTVSAMEAAFRPNMGIYKTEEGEFRGREGELSVPADLAGIVTGVFGLDQRRVARRRHIAQMADLKPLAASDLESLYSFPPGAAEGQKVAIAEFGGGYFPDDVATLCAGQGLPVPAIDIVAVNLKALTLADIQRLPQQQQQEELDESGEVMMDIEIVAELCSKAAISVYFATFDQKGWVDLLDRVVSDRPVALSVSWGAPEDSPDWSAAARQAINDRLQAAAAVGITVCVSSGDDGSGDELEDGRAHVDFPASSPFVLGVGGTMLIQQGNETVEQTWWESPGTRQGGGGATGGGVSVLFNRPSWQNVQVASVNQGAIDGRIVPDVAALAGSPFYELTLLGKTAPNGGTSASAPLWASLIARLNALLPAAKQQRFLTPLLYQAGTNGNPRGSTCHDIEVGDNISNPQPGVGYEAGAGFDAVTGWGTPNGTSLLAVL